MNERVIVAADRDKGAPINYEVRQSPADHHCKPAPKSFVVLQVGAFHLVWMDNCCVYLSLTRKPALRAVPQLVLL